MDGAAMKRFQFSIRMLLIVITLLAVVLGRIAYLRQNAAFHTQEARQYFARYRRQLKNQDWMARSLLGSSLDPIAIRTVQHLILADRFEFASYHPWELVDESQPVRLVPIEGSLLRFLGPDTVEVEPPLNIPELWTDLEDAMSTP